MATCRVFLAVLSPCASSISPSHHCRRTPAWTARSANGAALAGVALVNRNVPRNSREVPMEYRSSASLLGLPLVHIATGAVVDGRYRRGVATAWFAVGDIAIGMLFACGGVALGGV